MGLSPFLPSASAGEAAFQARDAVRVLRLMGLAPFLRSASGGEAAFQVCDVVGGPTASCA